MASCYAPIELVLEETEVFNTSVSSFSNVVTVPCGKCAACRSNKVDEWAFRLRQESKASATSLFITLTYDQDNLPRSDNNFPTLCKKDVQLFWKRLRMIQQRAFEELELKSLPIKYYIVGEYGENTKRPHYHAIAFNVFAPVVDRAWTAGVVDVRELTSYKAVGYVLKYLDKGRSVPLHARDDRVPEFSMMSKGIGKCYVENPDNLRWHKSDITRRFVQDDDGKGGLKKIRMPRYYIKQIFNNTELTLQRGYLQKLRDDKQAANYRAFISRRKLPDNQDSWFTYLKYVYDGYMGAQGRFDKLINDGKVRELKET